MIRRFAHGVFTPVRTHLLRRCAPARTHLLRRCPTRHGSSLADITARVLSDGERARISLPGLSLAALEELTVALPPTPVTMLMLKASARDRSAKSRIAQAQFIRRELIARRAHILTLLHEMPEPIAGQPAVGALAALYWRRLSGLLSEPDIVTEEDERAFFARQREWNAQIQRIGTAEEEHMCIEALAAVQAERGSDWWETHPGERLAVDRQLDGIFLARIGLRFLLSHYIACDAPRDGHAGVLHLRCSPVAECRAVAAAVEAQVRAAHGAAPAVEVVGDESKTFTFVASHIRYVVGTLLHNSSVATVRHHHRQRCRGALADGAPLPPVRVVVAVSGDQVQIKFADEAGGIRRSSLVNVWSYRALESAWWSAADGLSLPLARLYCKYFGGSIGLVPMEGWGTDCYVSFNRLASENAEHLVPVPTKELDEGHGRGLFDAQSRRNVEVERSPRSV